MSEKVAIQGMPGSYTEMALRSIEPDITSSDVMYLETFDQAFNAVKELEASRAVVAFSNTRIDSIQRPAELLLGHGSREFWVNGGTTLPVHHCLAGVEGSSVEGLRTVVSQPEALRQCDNLLRQLNGQVTAEESRDTALSAEHVSQLGDPGTAAICSEAAAKLYGLSILKHSVQDDSINMTRFVRFVRHQDRRIDEKPDNSIVVLTLPNEEGSLHRVTGVLDAHDINMRTIKSRNIPNTPMWVDIVTELERGADDLREVVGELALAGTRLTIIGTYKDSSDAELLRSTAPAENLVPPDPVTELRRYDELMDMLRV